MNKTVLFWLALGIVGAGCFYGGFRVGELNGRVEQAAKNTGPLMNLLLAQAGMGQDLVEMNREQLYSNLSFYETVQSSRLMTAANKERAKQNILLARDYWTAAGGKILQTEEEARQRRQQTAAFRSATGVQMAVIMNGVRVSPFYFEEEDRRIRDLFGRYSGQTSALHGMIVGMVERAKKHSQPQQSPPPTAPAAAKSEPRRPY